MLSFSLPLQPGATRRLGIVARLRGRRRGARPGTRRPLGLLSFSRPSSQSPPGCTGIAARMRRPCREELARDKTAANGREFLCARTTLSATAEKNHALGGVREPRRRRGARPEGAAPPRSSYGREFLCTEDASSATAENSCAHGRRSRSVDHLVLRAPAECLRDGPRSFGTGNRDGPRGLAPRPAPTPAQRRPRREAGGDGRARGRAGAWGRAYSASGATTGSALTRSEPRP